jgi:hypothetical protein
MLRYLRVPLLRCLCVPPAYVVLTYADVCYADADVCYAVCASGIRCADVLGVAFIAGC